MIDLIDSLDSKAADLGELMREISEQFRSLNTDAACRTSMELSMQEFRVVEHLGMVGPRMMRELAEYLKLAVNSVTALVDHLERKGFVSRHRSEEDRRVVRVGLTAVGENAYEEIAAGKARFFRRMLASLTDEEQAIFLLLFRKIARAGRSEILA
jgi:DNA-binding MarR family transcriptional regulator